MELKSQKIPVLALLVCTTSGLFYCLEYLIQVSPSVMFDQMITAYHTSPIGIALMGSFFFYAYAAMQVPVGIFTDRYGTRFPVAIAMLFCSIAVLYWSQANNITQAICARVVIGGTSAFAYITALTLIKQRLSKNYFTTAISSLQCLGAIGAMCGQMPLLTLSNKIGWQGMLKVLSACLIIIAGLLFLLQFRSTSRDQKDQSIKLDSRSICIIDVIKLGKFWQIFFIGAICWLPAGAFAALWGVPFLQKQFSINSLESSQIMMFFWLGLSFSPVIGIIHDKLKNTTILVVSLFSIATISMLIILYTDVKILTITGLFLLGVSCANQSLSMVLVKNCFQDKIFARVASIINMSAIIGAGLVQYAIGLIITHLEPGMTNTQQYQLKTYQIAISLIPCCAGIMVIILMMNYIKKIQVKNLISDIHPM